MSVPSAFDDYLDRKVWVAWAYDSGRKVPKSPFGGNASVTDDSTWGTYAQARRQADRMGYDGVGIILVDGLTGIDLDHVIDANGEISESARELIDRVGSYAELSPSGDGVHILLTADTQNTGPIGRTNRADGVEMYNHWRYFTVTGDQINDAGIEERTELASTLANELFNGQSVESQVRAQVGSLARSQVKRMANKTMRWNAARDNVRYARVPTGSETCGFCLMLASRGFVYASERTAGELNHYHRNDDCRIIPSFDGESVEGYEPDALYDVYRTAYESLGQRDGILALWNELPASDVSARIARHNDDWADAFNAFSNEQIARRIEILRSGSPRNR